MKKNKELETELEAQYGDILLKSFAQYWGGHRRFVPGGTLSPYSMGMMYLFENHFLFRSDVARQEKYGEILIPIKSIITGNWEANSSKLSKSKESFGIFEDIDGKKKFVVPFVDEDGIKHEPVFGITTTIGIYKSVGVAKIGGGGLTKWIETFFDIIIKNRKKFELESKPNHEINKWIEEGESIILDFKSEKILSDPYKLGKVMVAFANNKSIEGKIGGKIVIGINDEKKVEGIKPDQKHEEHIMQVASSRCDPPIKPIFERINHYGKAIYIISIPKMKKFPHKLKTKDGGVYIIRTGTITREATSEELAELYGTAIQNKSEEIRNQQVLQQIFKNCESLKGKMEYLKGIAQSKELLITQFKEYVDGKNNLVDETREIISNPLIVFNKELKDEIITVLQICRYKPAQTAIDPALKMARERKLLENGWKQDFTDFNIGSRFVDNNTDEAIVAVTNLLNRLEPIVKNGHKL